MRIASGDWALTLDPAAGGLIRALTRRGADILRPMPEGSAEPLESACFPLAPYANRIAHGRFDWEGETFSLTPNHPAIAHPIHGTTWLGEWMVRDSRGDSVTLVHAHTADADWPWSFALTQTLCLSAQGLTARLAITNTDARAMPAGLGFHPWFAREDVTAISFGAKGLWLGDAEMLPTEHTAPDALGDWSTPSPLELPHLVDNCYTGWDGTVRIARRDGDLVLESAGTPYLHLFVPQGADFFCAEPQTTMPDAVNRDAPAPLEPGATRALEMTIRSA
ncbi:aldose 1-epimerase [Novosphingobium decolorationis]|uniref:Aldose 1-epimerase n=1 Tax=Novosphingobium decolorationis TaxID=2698673 RepID=A0ABX8E882_9SPHN|nr:aldose 1-epimerase [Novosphingobium decolorationis]MED5543893.1 aldose 1-epimerase [Pseudomonadota bacterium]QVM85150.1 aldose 1-epimerase [Novosphingobium decolorationis]